MAGSRTTFIFTMVVMVVAGGMNDGRMASGWVGGFLQVHRSGSDVPPSPA